MERNPTSAVLSELGLINLMLTRHSTPLPATSTYARGRKGLDNGFATSHVVQALEACGYEAFNMRYTTDHQPYFSILIRTSCSEMQHYCLQLQPNVSSIPTMLNRLPATSKNFMICLRSVTLLTEHASCCFLGIAMALPNDSTPIW